MADDSSTALLSTQNCCAIKTIIRDDVMLTRIRRHLRYRQNISSNALEKDYLQLRFLL